MLVPAFPVYTSTPPPTSELPQPILSASSFAILAIKKKNKPLTESTLYHQQTFSPYFILEVWGIQRQKDVVSDLKELLEQGGQHS